MMHRFEGLEGHLAVVLDLVHWNLIVDLKYIENTFRNITFGQL